MNHALPRIVVTAGEPAGIGPDLCLALARLDLACELTILADSEVLAARAQLLGQSVTLRDANELRNTNKPHDSAVSRAPQRNTLYVAHRPAARPVEPGRLDAANSRHVLALLDAAVDGAMSGRYDAIVTAPVQKSIINEAGVPFTGHTEYLAERTAAPLPVMMLVTDRLRVALATTHLPLRAVADAITPTLLDQVLAIMDRDLRERFGFAKPRIAVCGLNPHAGESGHLGDEEIRVIIPALRRARSAGIDASGPVPADTLFVPRNLTQYDAVLAMFHDQGLPVLKHAGFGHAVNVTLGLPLLRTSVDHGTALELAGTGRADAGSLIAAVELAIQLVQRRLQQPALPQI